MNKKILIVCFIMILCFLGSCSKHEMQRVVINEKYAFANTANDKSVLLCDNRVILTEDNYYGYAFSDYYEYIYVSYFFTFMDETDLRYYAVDLGSNCFIPVSVDELSVADEEWTILKWEVNN